MGIGGGVRPASQAWRATTAIRVARKVPSSRQGLGDFHRIFNRLGRHRLHPHAYSKDSKLLPRLRNFRIRRLGAGDYQGFARRYGLTLGLYSPVEWFRQVQSAGLQLYDGDKVVCVPTWPPLYYAPISSGYLECLTMGRSSSAAAVRTAIKAHASLIDLTIAARSIMALAMR